MKETILKLSCLVVGPFVGGLFGLSGLIMNLAGSPAWNIPWYVHLLALVFSITYCFLVDLKYHFTRHYPPF